MAESELVVDDATLDLLDRIASTGDDPDQLARVLDATPDDLGAFLDAAGLLDDERTLPLVAAVSEYRGGKKSHRLPMHNVRRLQIRPAAIADIVGQGTESIREIQDTTGVQVTVDPMGLVVMSGADADSLDRAQEMLGRIVQQSLERRPRSNLTPSVSQASANLLTTVGEYARMEGRFDIADSIQIECELAGELNVGGKLVVGARGIVAANIQTVDALIMGQYEGNMIATGTVEIASTARVAGNIKTDSLIIAKGGFFNGNVSKIDDLPLVYLVRIYEVPEARPDSQFIASGSLLA